MAAARDIELAKQALSGRLLRAGMRRGPQALVMAMTVEAAVANTAFNAHGVGIGDKRVDGKLTDQQCIRVYVTQKLAPSLIPPQNLIPKEIDGIPTDVIKSPPAMIMPAKKRPKAASARAATAAPPDSDPKRMDRQRPIRGGISAAQFEVTAGTIACFCRSTRHGDDPAVIYALSNNHVFANINRAQPGDPIYQQSPMDGGVAADAVGTLARFVSLQLDGRGANTVDCALARIETGIDIDPAIAVIGKLSGTAAPAVRMAVRKHGRSSGYTEGMITDTQYDAIVGMDHTDSSVRAVFNNQFRIERTPPFDAFGIGGDSGSLVLAKDDAKAVGLYFAGPPSGVYGIANQIDAVLSELDIELL